MTTGYSYDERMLLHIDPHETSQPESPDRIVEIYRHLKDKNLLENCVFIPPTSINNEILEKVHSAEMIQYLQSLSDSG